MKTKLLEKIEEKLSQFKTCYGHEFSTAYKALTALKTAVEALDEVGDDPETAKVIADHALEQIESELS